MAKWETESTQSSHDGCREVGKAVSLQLTAAPVGTEELPLDSGRDSWAALLNPWEQAVPSPATIPCPCALESSVESPCHKAPSSHFAPVAEVCAGHTAGEGSVEDWGLILCFLRCRIPKGEPKCAQGL